MVARQKLGAAFSCAVAETALAVSVFRAGFRLSADRDLNPGPHFAGKMEPVLANYEPDSTSRRRAASVEKLYTAVPACAVTGI